MVDFSWDARYLTPLTALACFTVFFLTYLALLVSVPLERRLLDRYGAEEGQTRHVLWANKWSGFLLLGLLPALVIVFFLRLPLSDFGAGPVTHQATYTWMAGFGGFVLVVNWLQARRPAHYGVYPLIRRARWTPALLFSSLLASSAFIVAYEFLFRGFLLFACVPLMGAYIAVAVNVLVYALAHVHKGMGETLGSVPLGILLCWITLSTGTIWAVVVIHLALTLSADVFALYYNPDMKMDRA